MWTLGRNALGLNGRAILFTTWLKVLRSPAPRQSQISSTGLICISGTTTMELRG